MSEINEEDERIATRESSFVLVEKPPLSFDEAIWATGGFGTFQKFVTFTLINGFMTGSFIFYGLTFLEMFPKYECKVL